MKIAAWNLNHKTKAKRIPPEAVEVILRLAPDVLVLTEYVDSPERDRFKTELRELGLCFLSASRGLPKHNQILIASREEHKPTDICPIEADTHTETNVHAVSFPQEDLLLIGARRPVYNEPNAASLFEAGGRALFSLLEKLAKSRCVVIGDLNGDPDNEGSDGGKILRALRESGWRIPSPDGNWSYISPKGDYTSRLDHILLSRELRGPVSASYITRIADITVAGASSEHAISDHAILLCDVSTRVCSGKLSKRDLPTIAPD